MANCSKFLIGATRLRHNHMAAQHSDLLGNWRTLGYAVVPELISHTRAARLLEICNSILEQWRGRDPQTGAPGDKPDATVMRHLNHPDYFAQHPEWFAPLMDAAADERVRDVARAVFGEEPMFRCTSLFFNPSGIELDGNWHRDSQFGTPDDDAERNVIAKAGADGAGMQLQIALLPSDDIEVVPRSHLRWDSPEEYAIRKADGGVRNRAKNMPGAVRVRQASGDAVLFNAMAIHRGRYYASVPRRTLMLTYTRASQPHFDYFSNQPWFLDAGYLSALSAQTRAFFEPFVAQYREKWNS